MGISPLLLLLNHFSLDPSFGPSHINQAVSPDFTSIITEGRTIGGGNLLLPVEKKKAVIKTWLNDTRLHEKY